MEMILRMLEGNHQVYYLAVKPTLDQISYGSLFWPALLIHSKNYETICIFLHKTSTDIHFTGQKSQVTYLRRPCCDEIQLNRDMAEDIVRVVFIYKCVLVCMCTYILAKEILSIYLTFSLFPQTLSSGHTKLYCFSKI